MSLQQEPLAPSKSHTSESGRSNRRKSSLGLGDKVELLYCKSKVYIHPTTSSKDNIAGFLTLTKPHFNATNKDIVVSFTPENMVPPDDYKIYQEVDMAMVSEGSGGNDLSKLQIKSYYIERPLISSIMSYSFGILLANLFSLQLRPPSLGWWWGSVVLNSRSGEKIPVVFFHDDESPSTLKEQELRNKTFNVFSDQSGSTDLFWGGDQFLNILKSYCVLEKSSLENSIFLINPSSEDLINFQPPVEEKEEQPFNVNKFFNKAKWRFLETMASFTNKTREKVKDVVDESPEPIKLLLRKPEVKQVGEDFDSARVYLAKWAMAVQEDAERSRKKIILEDYYTTVMKNELGVDSIEKVLSPEEVSKTRRRKPISKVEWDTFFDNSGRLCITVAEVEERIFHGGFEDDVRKEAWPFIFGVYPWSSSKIERAKTRRNLFMVYSKLKNQWMDDYKRQDEDEFWKNQKFRIDKDINRCDRNLEIYKYNTEDGFKKHGASATTGETEDFDVANIKNPNLQILRNILITYNEYNVNLGYVQGMTDLLSPIFYILRDESLSFWCYTKFIVRMERNFLRDQSGMKHQMNTLNELVQFMLPDLYLHLEKADSNNLFFFFRMLLVWFKREFEYKDCLKLWEVLLTDYHSSQFHMFICLALLSKHEKIIMKHLVQFDQVLKYFNDLSMTIDLDDVLVRAELLFLRFKKMVEIIDRENRLKRSKGEPVDEDPVSADLRLLLSRKLVVEKESVRPEGHNGG